jgi:competence protein ComEC
MEESWFERKKKWIYLALVVFMILLFLIFTGQSQLLESREVSGEIEFHFIDVGQADATLIIQEDISILVDAGHWQRTDVIEYLNELNVSKIDLLIGTHPHADHIGQMDKILADFEVVEVWMSGYKQDSSLYKRVYEEIEKSGVGYKEPRAGEDYFLGNIEINVLNPVRLTRDIHESCLAMKVSFGDLSVMLTGDVEAKTELEMIKRNQKLPLGFFERFFSKDKNDLGVVVYQLGHHGSKTSSTREFLEAMSPGMGIYSAGKGNSYGHPDEEVIERFDEMGIPLYGTDEYGTIVVIGNEKGEFEVVKKR